MTKTLGNKRPRTAFVCNACGASSPRWLGRCASCGAWESLVEERVDGRASKGPSGNVAGDRTRPTPLSEVAPDAARRIETGLPELDRVLGGGPVLGGVVLLGGDPGIGKSTLLMQAMAGLAARGRKVLYASGEESAAQIALRARRLGCEGVDRVLVQATTELTEVEGAIDDEKPEVVVVDSIQTLRSSELESGPGSVTQLREVAARLVELAKRRGIALFLIGHVTKDGGLAGPKLLEHLVDTVLSFEGDATSSHRIVRASKNRFGPAQEIAVFEMVRDGLREVPDPSAHFLAERPARVSGSVVVPIAEGARPVLIEVQALVAPALYGQARRVAAGIEASRLAILLAVIERKAEVHVLDRDVFASVAGGARIEERAADLALAVAIVSSLRDRAVPSDLVVFGEVGLAGELRAVPRAPQRVLEAKKLGFRRIVMPKGNATQLTPEERRDVEIEAAGSLADALSRSFE
ncbi:MAG: DNA repair protein RadA [Deltaproteobacteria bacterium]|nr:DNA repair protein RadA [Deltaproteobacteria bacterium]